MTDTEDRGENEAGEVESGEAGASLEPHESLSGFETPSPLAPTVTRPQQNLPLAIAAGLAAAAVGAATWAGITVVTNTQWGLVAIAIGFVVGVAVRFGGNGVEPIFGAVGAVCAGLGCVAGNFLTSCAMVASEVQVGIFHVMSVMDLHVIGSIMAASFSPMDLVFYGIAVYEGYRFSFGTGQLGG